jgi:hypothetical protein
MCDSVDNASSDKNVIDSDYSNIVERLANASPSNVQEIAAAQIALLGSYHKQVLGQAQKSFLWALIAAGIGLLFLLGAIILRLINYQVDTSVISVVCGLIVEFISVVNFYLYNRASLQMAEYQERLDRTQRFLIANSICEGLEGDIKQKTRSRLVDSIASTVYSSDFFSKNTKNNQVKFHKNIEEKNEKDTEGSSE